MDLPNEIVSIGNINQRLGIKIILVNYFIWVMIVGHHYLQLQLLNHNYVLFPQSSLCRHDRNSRLEIDTVHTGHVVQGLSGDVVQGLNHNYVLFLVP